MAPATRKMRTRSRKMRPTGIRTLCVVSAALVFGAVWGSTPTAAQQWRNVSLSRALGAQSVLDVQVRYVAGDFEMAATHDAEQLYAFDLRYDEQQYEPVSEYSDGTLEVGAKSIRRNINVRKRTQARMDLRLTRAIPLRLDIEIGAAQVDLDLTGLRVQRLNFRTGASHSTVTIAEVNPVRMSSAKFAAGAAEFTARGLGNLNADEISVDAGVGDVTLDFSGEWQRDVRANIGMGLGALKLRIPRGLGVKLMKNSFLASFDARGLIRRGDAYYSEGYADATYRMEIEVDAAFGSIDIVWLN